MDIKLTYNNEIKAERQFADKLDKALIEKGFDLVVE